MTILGLVNKSTGLSVHPRAGNIINDSLASGTTIKDALNSLSVISGDNLSRTVYDPNGVNGDVFNMDNMVEGSSNKILTTTERTILGNTSGINTGDQDLSGYQLTSEKNVANGYAGLDASGLIDPTQIQNANVNIVYANSSAPENGNGSILYPFDNITDALDLLATFDRDIVKILQITAGSDFSTEDYTIIGGYTLINSDGYYKLGNITWQRDINLIPTWCRGTLIISTDQLGEGSSTYTSLGTSVNIASLTLTNPSAHLGQAFELYLYNFDIKGNFDTTAETQDINIYAKNGQCDGTTNTPTADWQIVYSVEFDSQLICDIIGRFDFCEIQGGIISARMSSGLPPAGIFRSVITGDIDGAFEYQVDQYTYNNWTGGSLLNGATLNVVDQVWTEDKDTGTASFTGDINIENSTGDVTSSIISSDTGNSILYFGDQTSATVGGIDYDHAEDSMSFNTSGIKRMYIDDWNVVLGNGTSAPYFNVIKKSNNSGGYYIYDELLGARGVYLIQNLGEDGILGTTLNDMYVATSDTKRTKWIQNTEQIMHGLPDSEDWTIAIESLFNVRRNTNSEISILTDDAGSSTLNFGDKTDYNTGKIDYDHADDSMDFQTSGAVQMSLESDGDFRIYNGNLSIGTSAAGLGGQGITLYHTSYPQQRWVSATTGVGGIAGFLIGMVGGGDMQFKNYENNRRVIFELADGTGTSKDVLDLYHNKVTIPVGLSISDNTDISGALTVNNTNAVNGADYTILDNDKYSDIDFTTGITDRTCILPTLADNVGRIIWISKVDAGAGKVTVSCEGVDTFLDTTTSVDLINQGDTLALKASTNGWKVF